MIGHACYQIDIHFTDVFELITPYSLLKRRSTAHNFKRFSKEYKNLLFYYEKITNNNFQKKEWEEMFEWHKSNFVEKLGNLKSNCLEKNSSCLQLSNSFTILNSSCKLAANRNITFQQVPNQFALDLNPSTRNDSPKFSSFQVWLYWQANTVFYICLIKPTVKSNPSSISHISPNSFHEIFKLFYNSEISVDCKSALGLANKTLKLTENEKNTGNSDSRIDVPGKPPKVIFPKETPLDLPSSGDRFSTRRILSREDNREEKSKKTDFRKFSTPLNCPPSAGTPQKPFRKILCLLLLFFCAFSRKGLPVVASDERDSNGR